MRAERDGVLRNKLDASAAWSADLSPIRSPTPHQTPQCTTGRPTVHHSPYSLSTRGYITNLVEGHSFQTRQPKAALPFPHLVRSRSPPGHLWTSPSASMLTAAGCDMDAKSTVLSKEPTTLRNTRMQDTFADVLSRDWPFESLPTDTEALTAAVRVGQESALIHYANSGFKDMSSRLAREASAVGMETDRYRLAAQYSSMQCKDALRAYKHAQAELAAAQQEVRTLISKEEQADALQSRLASPDSSIDALATQLDQELAQMRTQKQRYELLCSQKSQLEAKVDDWTAKEKNLETKLDRVQVRCAKECEDALRGIHAKRALSGECTLEGQTKSAKACLRDFDVCIMERLELLRHLQRGAADRIEKLKTFLNHTREHHPHGCGEGKGSPREEAHEVSAAQTAAEGDTAHGCEREGSSRKTVDGETPEGDTSMQLLDYLAKVQQTVALGEEEALTEMEHLRVQLRRLQRQEDS